MNIISLESYMEDFLPSLENFCSKSPLQPSISYIPEQAKIILTLPDGLSTKTLSFMIDPTKDKKVIIKEIKVALENEYPIIFDKKVFPLTTEEIENEVANGKELRQVLAIRTETYLPRYKLLRIHNKYNEIDCYDFKTRKLIKFKLNIPLTVFMSKLFSSNREQISNFFSHDTRFAYVIKKTN